MKKSILAVAVLLPLAACTQAETTGAVLGGAGGAAVGAVAAGGGSELEGALVGGAIGATAGALLGRASEQNRCRYRDAYGREYVAECPRGYY